MLDDGSCGSFYLLRIFYSVKTIIDKHNIKTSISPVSVRELSSFRTWIGRSTIYSF